MSWQFFFRSSTRLPCWSQASWKSCDEADAALDQPAGQQAVVGERRLARLGAVQLEDVLAARCADVHQLRGAGLHAEGHLEGVDARGDLRVADCVEPHLVQRADRRRASRAAARRRRRGGLERYRTGSPLPRNGTPW